MLSLKHYSWVVSFDDGTRLSYDFQMDSDCSWPEVLQRFASFLEKEGYPGVQETVDEICAEKTQRLQEIIEGSEALQQLHSNDSSTGKH